MSLNKYLGLIFGNNFKIGYIYFYVHFITELICFYSLGKVIGSSYIIWFIPLLYDALAFLPQSIIGYFSDKYKSIDMGYIGIILLIIGIILLYMGSSYIVTFLFIGIGNAFMHISGAEATLRSSRGMMSPACIFVSGGSFGVVLGKVLSSTSINPLYLIIFILTMAPSIYLASVYSLDYKGNLLDCKNYNYASNKVKISTIILLSVLVVIIRGYMGYGIPTSWNKTIFETILLFSFMGIGKALGGVLIDIIGIRKTSIISTICAIPFLLFGDKIMIISLFGVLMFSLTMGITLALLVSVLKSTPGLAFGLTTIGLFLGSIPLFFFKIDSILINDIVISISSIICLIILLKITRKEGINV